MKLLQINILANLGSTGRIAEQIGIVAMKQGWDSYIAYGRSIGKSHSMLIKVGNKLDMIYHGIVSRLFDRHGLASRIATRRLVKQIKYIKPDIIHLHNIHGYYLNYKILFEYLARTKIPVVWTLHDCWSFTGHCAYFDEPNCYKWHVECNSCPVIHSYPKSVFADRSNKNYRLKQELFGTMSERLYLVPVSEWLLNFTKESFLNKSKALVIHNGVDLQKFNIQSTSYSNKYTIIGVAMPWSKRKGLSDFVVLRKKLDPSKYDIILIGLTDSQIKDLPHGIIGRKGTHSIEELAYLYGSADVFINPTYADNFPTTNLEALACGTPVITYRTGGSPESVTPQTGVVVEQGDVEGIINAIQMLEQRDRDELRKACRTYAEEHFDKDKCFQKYIDLYKEILSKK